MTDPSPTWLAELQALAIEFCKSVVLIDAPPEVRPWNADQVLWAGESSPDPADRVLAYRSLGDAAGRVAVLGEGSRGCFSRFVETFRSQRDYGECYGVAFLRDMLVGLLQLSLPGATIEQVASPYWKRYVAQAVQQIQAGSAQRYGEAVVLAIRALPAPHPATVIILPLAGVATLVPRTLGGVTLLPGASCTADPEISGCAMFLRRLKELQNKRQEAPLVFAKVHARAEPGLAVEIAVRVTDQICRLLRLLPNPGLGDGPLTDPPRIDLDAEDSAAFYIAETSVGTHPIPVRRTNSDPQGKLNNWRVEPRLEDSWWERLAEIIERGATNDIEARLLAGLRHLGDAMAEPAAAPAAFMAATALEALLGAPESAEQQQAAENAPEQLGERVALLLTERGEARRAVRDRAVQVCRLRRQLLHDLDRPVLPGERAVAVWLAYAALKHLLQYDKLRGYEDLQKLLRRR